MSGAKQAWLGLNALIVCTCVLVSAARADDTPREILQAAIKAHGGEKNLARTLTGTILARAKTSLAAGLESTFSWEETFELPRRYRRKISGDIKGKFTLEYAITDGNGWIRYNGEEPTAYKGQKMPLSSSWNAILGILPSCLADGVKLAPGGKDKIEGREAVGVTVSSEALGVKALLFFDSKSRRLVKSKRRNQHPFSGKEVDAQTVLGNYKEVSGVQYPHRFAVYIDGKSAIDMEIVRIEFLKKVDDRLFEKP